MSFWLDLLLHGVVSLAAGGVVATAFHLVRRWRRHRRGVFTEAELRRKHHIPDALEIVTGEDGTFVMCPTDAQFDDAWETMAKVSKHIVWWSAEVDGTVHRVGRCLGCYYPACAVRKGHQAMPIEADKISVNRVGEGRPVTCMRCMS